MAQIEPVSTKGSDKQAEKPSVSCEVKGRVAPCDEGRPPGLALDGAEASLRVDEGLIAGAGDSWAGISDEDTGAVVAVVGLDTLG